LALGKNYDIGTGPSHQLEVDGQVQISGGGPSSGDFLKSTNGNGSATWASISEGDVSGVIENVSAGNDINVNGGNSGTQTVAVEKAIDIEESLYENLEETDVNASIGNVYFDKNFDNAGESGDGNYFGDGGGFVAYNETGWGAIVTDENMEHLSAKLYGLHVGGTENPGEDVARIGNVGTLNSPGQGSFQNNSNYSGDGYTETPFVYTSFIEAIDERGGGATGIAVGADNSFTGNDEISLITTGDEQLRVNPDGNVGIHTTGANKANLHVDVDSDERGVHVEGNWDGVSGIVRSMLVKNNGHSSGGAKYRAIQGAALGNTSSSGRTHGVFGKGGGRDLNIGVYGKLASGTGAGVYATTSGANLDLENNTYAAFFNGDVTWTGSHSSTSDRRLKKDISPLKNNLAKVMQLGVYAYRFKDHEMLELGDGKQYGFIAQEVEQVAPALVENNIGGDYKGLNQLQIMPLLAGAIQEQQQLHQDKDQRIQELKQRVQKQQQQIEQLQQAVQELQGQARR
jgi:hypothetical protein